MRDELREFGKLANSSHIYFDDEEKMILADPDDLRDRLSDIIDSLPDPLLPLLLRYASELQEEGEDLL